MFRTCTISKRDSVNMASFMIVSTTSDGVMCLSCHQVVPKSFTYNFILLPASSPLQEWVFSALPGMMTTSTAETMLGG